MWNRQESFLLLLRILLENTKSFHYLDLHEYLGGPSLCPSSTPHPITGETVPLTFGHEFSGTVEEIGEGVTKVVIGDHVAVQPIIYDGTCGACLAGNINCCWQNGFIGLSGM